MKASLISSLPILTLITLGFSGGLSGCSLLFGNIRPVEEKSERYSVIDLSQGDQTWVPLHSSKTSPIEEGYRSDRAYQSKATGSIVSITSVCKHYEPSERRPSLQELTRELVLGSIQVQSREEKTISVQGIPALQSTFHGKSDNKEISLQTVVFEKERCIFDLMLVSKPEHLSKDEPSFSKFVSSLKIR